MISDKDLECLDSAIENKWTPKEAAFVQSNLSELVQCYKTHHAEHSGVSTIDSRSMSWASLVDKTIHLEQQIRYMQGDHGRLEERIEGLKTEIKQIRGKIGD